MFSCQICVEYDAAAVHVTILVLQKHLLNLKMYQKPGCNCEVCGFLFLFAIYIVQDKNNQVGKMNKCLIIHNLDLNCR